MTQDALWTQVCRCPACGPGHALADTLLGWTGPDGTWHPAPLCSACLRRACYRATPDVTCG